MSLAVSDEAGHLPCSTCGSVVESRSVTMVSGPHAGATFTTPKRHDAPCGLPCMGGGIGSEVLRSMREAGKRLADVTHGSIGGPCTACGYDARKVAPYA